MVTFFFFFALSLKCSRCVFCVCGPLISYHGELSICRLYHFWISASCSLGLIVFFCMWRGVCCFCSVFLCMFSCLLLWLVFSPLCQCIHPIFVSSVIASAVVDIQGDEVFYFPCGHRAYLSQHPDPRARLRKTSAAFQQVMI